MIQNSSKHIHTLQSSFPFSILIPTWNNKPYIQLCVESILKNSYFKNQIIVIVNEGKDGTLEWVEDMKEVDYIYSENNIGICYGLNSARSLIKSNYIVYVNDDMYLLPNWDLALSKEIEAIGHPLFMLSSTMIEPIHTNNPCVVVKDFGRDIETFREDLILKEHSTLYRDDWSGSTWPPNVVHIDLWDLVGGLSIEYSPGMYSDPDFSRKLYEAGVRIFKGKGDSLVYHFGSKSTKRIRKNKGRKTFLLKWGITSGSFMQNFLQMGQPYSNKQINPKELHKNTCFNKLKCMLSCLK